MLGIQGQSVHIELISHTAAAIQYCVVLLSGLSD